MRPPAICRAVAAGGLTTWPSRPEGSPTPSSCSLRPSRRTPDSRESDGRCWAGSGCGDRLGNPRAARHRSGLLRRNGVLGGAHGRECFGNDYHRGPWGVDRRFRYRRRHRRNPRRRGGPRRVPVVEATYPASAHVTEKVIRTPRRSTAVFVTHELLRREAVEERAYQVNIARACLERSTLVVLPTGM